jgi:hypothetical protein
LRVPRLPLLRSHRRSGQIVLTRPKLGESRSKLKIGFS